MKRTAKTGQKAVVLTVCVVCLTVSYNLQKATELSATQEVEKSAIRTVIFRSHLDGSLDDDPKVRVGERVQVAPAASEPTSKHDPILVKLPTRTPFTHDDELYYLRGFAVGQLSAQNLQFL
jgi:hypothetical protein